MDFKSLLSSRIAASKPSQTTSSSTSTTTTSSINTSASKYTRRADLEAVRQRQYAEEQARIEQERQEKLKRKHEQEEEEATRHAAREEKKRKLAEESRLRREQEEIEEEARRRKRLGLPPLPAPTDANDNNTTQEQDDLDLSTLPDIDEADLHSKLRTLNQPITLFEEDHRARLTRYYRLTSHPTSKRKPPKPHLYPGAIPTTLEPLPPDSILLPSKPPSTSSVDEYTLHHRKLTSYLNLLLGTWQHALSTRDPAVAHSPTGTAALAQHHTALADLKPLFRRLETHDLPPALLGPLTEILHLTQRRCYRDATDRYLVLSIGRAAWPIGVTMVGIHERSAREKLNSGEGEKANIMSDEVTRRWLQSVKRCVSFAQTRFPPDDVGQLMG